MLGDRAVYTTGAIMGTFLDLTFFMIPSFYLTFLIPLRKGQGLASQLEYRQNLMNSLVMIIKHDGYMYF